MESVLLKTREERNETKRKNSTIDSNAVAAFLGQLIRALQFPEDLANLDSLYDNYQNQYMVRVDRMK